MTKIPYKINLSEDELPKYWQNIRPYMQEAPDPFINPVIFKPCTADDLRPVFCDELIEQELDNTNKFIEIPEEIRDRLFERFFRADEARADNGHFGLGLSIAHSIVTNHSGKITVERQGDKNVFSVMLPVTFHK